MEKQAVQVEGIMVMVEDLSTLDKLRLMELLASRLKRDLAMEQKTETKSDWATFIDETAGSLAADPIKRWPQGEYEERDVIE